MALHRNPEHDYPTEPDPKGWYRCRRCGKPTRDPEADLSWCNGLQQTELSAAGDPHADDPTRYGPYHAWVATLPCLLADRPDHRCAGRITGHHVRSVGAGGRDRGNEVPLCERAHRAVHRAGQVTFEERHEVDLGAVARTLERRWTSEFKEKERLET